MADIFDMADTWNDGGTTFAAIKMDVTDTASAAASLLMDLQVGSTSRLSVRKDGQITVRGDLGATPFLTNSGSTTTGLSFITSTNLSWYVSTFERIRFGSGGQLGLTDGVGLGPTPGAPDAYLFRDAANVVGQRNGSNAQAHHWYETYTNASNYSRAYLSTAGSAVTLGSAAAGTGTKRNVVLDGANRATLVADASDEASAITLVNALKAAAISHGLMAAA